MDAPGVAMEMQRSRPSILIVEENAHRTEGHYAELFAELALAISDLDRRVTVLTSRGWALADDPEFAHLDRCEFGSLVTFVLRATDTLTRRTSWHGLKLLANFPRSAALIGATRARQRQLRADVVISTGRGVHPLLGAMIATRGDWLLYRFDGPSDWLAGTDAPHGFARTRKLARRATLALSRSLQERHRGSIRIVVNNDEVRDRWERVAPWLAPASVPFAMCHSGRRIPTAREDLGFAANDRIALLFGAPHGGKDLDTVWRAFGYLPDWRLVVAGRGSDDAYRAWSRTHGPLSPAPVLIDGFVDRRTRALLYSAADLSILSFKPGTTHDSGTLTDTLTWGVGVVCSDGCPAADLLRRHRVGAVFEAQDPLSLADAVRRGAPTADSIALETAREELSAAAVARRVLNLVGAPCE